LATASTTSATASKTSTTASTTSATASTTSNRLQTRLARFVLVQYTKVGKLEKPKCHKIKQMTTKYAGIQNGHKNLKIFLSKPFKNLPKFVELE
jgi:hypothetical protein